MFGERLDGWTNADHPTESVPGDATTLPQGANPNDADLDYIATGEHPAGGLPGLSMADKMTVVRWIDLGAPIDLSVIRGSPGMGWFLDDLKPTLTISQPRINFNAGLVNLIRLGMADGNSGLDMSTLSVMADFTVNGRPANNELGDLLVNTSDGVYELTLSQPVPVDDLERHVRAEVADVQGNITRVDVRFYTSDPDIIFTDDFEP